MTHALIFPGANTTAQWFADDYPGTTFTSMEKFLTHSTEGAGWPGYRGGAIAPNMTGKPNFSTRRIDWRQHWPANQSSRALAHTQTQPTNGDHVFQVELVGTCVRGGPGLYWPAAPDWALEGVAEVIAWLNAEWGLAKASTVTWRNYDDPGDWQRLGNRAYDAYRGVLGHQHAPQNDHRDPGKIDIQKILRMAGGTGTVSADQPTLNEIQNGILYYDLGDTYVNPLTMIKRTYDAVQALALGEKDENARVLAIQAMLAGMADNVAAKVVAALPPAGTGEGGQLTPADVEAAVKSALREGVGA